MYLRVITIAELCNEKGNLIPANRFTGLWQSTSTLNWPKIPKPPAKALTQFRNILQKAIGSSNNGNRRRNSILLAKPLGMWIKAKRHILYNAYRTNNSLYLRHDGYFEEYTQKTTNIFHQPKITATMDDFVIPVAHGSRNNEAWTSEIYNIHLQVSQSMTAPETITADYSKPLAG